MSLTQRFDRPNGGPGSQFLMPSSSYPTFPTTMSKKYSRPVDTFRPTHGEIQQSVLELNLSPQSLTTSISDNGFSWLDSGPCTPVAAEMGESDTTVVVMSSHENQRVCNSPRFELDSMPPSAKKRHSKALSSSTAKIGAGEMYSAPISFERGPSAPESASSHSTRSVSTSPVRSLSSISSAEKDAPAMKRKNFQGLTVSTLKVPERTKMEIDSRKFLKSDP